MNRCRVEELGLRLWGMIDEAPSVSAAAQPKGGMGGKAMLWGRGEPIKLHTLRYGGSGPIMLNRCSARAHT